jgi:hypothetical protein
VPERQEQWGVFKKGLKNTAIPVKKRIVYPIESFNNIIVLLQKPSEPVSPSDLLRPSPFSAGAGMMGEPRVPGGKDAQKPNP